MLQCANAVDWCDEQEDGSAQCLTENQLCDGTPNCNNGYDESNFVCVSKSGGRHPVLRPIYFFFATPPSEVDAPPL